MTRALTYGWAAVAVLSAFLAAYTWGDPSGPWWIPAVLTVIAVVAAGGGIAWHRSTRDRD